MKTAAEQAAVSLYELSTNSNAINCPRRPSIERNPAGRSAKADISHDPEAVKMALPKGADRR